MLSDNKGRMINHYTSDYVVFDIETTGLDPENDRVVEIAAVKVRDGRKIDTFQTLVDPGCHIPQTAVDISGITDSMVKGAPDIRTALKMFDGFADDMTLVGQNIRRFDLKFLQRDSLALFGKVIGNDYADTLCLAKVMLPERESYSLSSLSEYYNVSTLGAHRALADCEMTRQVFEYLGREEAHPSEAAKAVLRCPLCGSKLKRREGRFGSFYGCSIYPDCKYTKDIS
ncbi:MAG: topoisomerase DNA-binding C4 zinc finger domain-containing protein [Clostridiales bacterium]|nr:topoisomerase DNA-binding C4 zinc finger domain-containing protein [Clostridiales bacterium]